MAHAHWRSAKGHSVNTTNCLVRKEKNLPVDQFNHTRATNKAEIWNPGDEVEEPGNALAQ